jgi:hypothetical protein
MRALIVFLAALPTVLYASDGEVIQPSCAHPAGLEDLPPGHGGYPGDYIIFTALIDSGAGVTTLQEPYHLAAFTPVKWKGLDAVRVVLPVLTPAQVAELRCEPVVELVVRDLEPRPASSAGDRPRKVQLGLELRPVNGEDAAGRNPRGMVVTRVVPGSVASRANIRENDYILKFDGHDVNSIQDLWRLMGEKNPGDAVPLITLRDGAELSVFVQF